MGYSYNENICSMAYNHNKWMVQKRRENRIGYQACLTYLQDYLTNLFARISPYFG